MAFGQSQVDGVVSMWISDQQGGTEGPDLRGWGRCDAGLMHLITSEVRSQFVGFTL